MQEDVRQVAHPFDADTLVEDLGQGRYGATLSERWWVEKGPNGGYLAAVVLRAIQAAAGAERAPRSLTVHFPRAPEAGEVEVAVTIERRGRTATFVSTRLEQDGVLQASALAVLSGDWDAPGFNEATMPEVEPAGELYFPDPSQVEGMPAMLQNYGVRPAGGETAFSGGPARHAAWLRTREPRPLDAPLAAAMLDAWFPAPFVKIERAVPAPTIDYTVHFRSPLPRPETAADEPHLLVFRTGLARHGFFEEDGELWSADGTLLAHSRQLALLLERAVD